MSAQPTSGGAEREPVAKPVTALEFLRKVTEVATAVGFQANVGAMETAGQIVSVLAANPEHLDRFMVEGSGLFIDGTFNPQHGCLSFYAINGTINTPANLRRRMGMIDQ